jgi:hypothetical protein
MASRTAEAYRSAATRILAIDGEDWLGTDLRSIDVDMQMDRFVRLEGTNFKPETLQTYKSRVRSAIGEYLRYIDNPKSYRRPTSPRSERQRTSNRGGSSRLGSGGSDTGVPPQTEDRPAADGAVGDRPNLVKYPFPLRSGQMAYFELPRDLSRAEAQRMAAFIASLAIDGFLELSPGKGREP